MTQHDETTSAYANGGLVIGPGPAVPIEPGPAPYVITRKAAERLGLSSDFLAELNEPRDPPRPPNCICRYPLHEAHADCPAHGHDAILRDTDNPR